MTAYFAKNNETQLAKAGWMQKTQKKNEILDRIAVAARNSIDYGVIVAQGSNAILQEIGWGTRHALTALQPRGQCTAFEIIGQGDGWVRLNWKEPADSGKVAAYKVHRSEAGSNFSDAGTAVVESEAAIFNQPKGKSLICRAVAINKAVEGLPSNTVSIVL